MTARVCNYCSNPGCPYECVPVENQQAWLREKIAAGMPCWVPFPENVGVVHDEEGHFIKERTIFQNDNGAADEFERAAKAFLAEDHD